MIWVDGGRKYSSKGKGRVLLLLRGIMVVAIYVLYRADQLQYE